MRRMTQYVIVGNSIAAVGCIEGIRREDRESPITVCEFCPTLRQYPLPWHYRSSPTKAKGKNPS